MPFVRARSDWFVSLVASATVDVWWSDRSVNRLAVQLDVDAQNLHEHMSTCEDFGVDLACSRPNRADVCVPRCGSPKGRIGSTIGPENERIGSKFGPMIGILGFGIRS